MFTLLIKLLNVNMGRIEEREKERERATHAVLKQEEREHKKD